MKILWTPIGIALLLGQFCAAAERIAVADLTKIFKAHPETIAAESVLDQQRKANREVYKEKSNKLKELLQKHQETTRLLVQAGSRASDALKAQAKSLLDQAAKVEKEIALLRTTQQRDLEQKFLDEKARILGLVSRTIADYNKDGTYALILDSSALSSTGLPQVIHAPGATDITASIIARIKK